MFTGKIDSKYIKYNKDSRDSEKGFTAIFLKIKRNDFSGIGSVYSESFF